MLKYIGSFVFAFYMLAVLSDATRDEKNEERRFTLVGGNYRILGDSNPNQQVTNNQGSSSRIGRVEFIDLDEDDNEQHQSIVVRNDNYNSNDKGKRTNESINGDRMTQSRKFDEFLSSSSNKRPRFGVLTSDEDKAAISKNLLDRYKVVLEKEFNNAVADIKRDHQNRYQYFSDKLKHDNFVEYANKLDEILRESGNFGNIKEEEDIQNNRVGFEHLQPTPAPQWQPTNWFPSSFDTAIASNDTRIPQFNASSGSHQFPAHLFSDSFRPYGKNPNEKCTLCSENVNEDVGEPIVQTHCNHKFHKSCLHASADSQVSWDT